MAERVEIDIIANVTKAVSGLEKLVKQLAATYLGYRALKDFLVSSIKEALEAERAYVALGSAMRSSGQNAEIYTKQLQGLARALSMTTTFAEEETMAAMQSLTQIGRVSAEGMKKVIPVVQDLAAGLGIDLNAAALLVGKAIEGNTGALGRYGIKIKETADPAERFSAIIAELTERFGGMSEAMAKSASGGLKQIKNEFNELKEAVGNRLLQAFKDTIFGLASMMKSSVIMNMPIADIGSIAEARAYLTVLQREFDRLNDIKKSWGFVVNPKVQYEPGGAIDTTLKRLTEVQNKMEGIKRLTATMSQASGVSGGPLLPGLTDNTVVQIDKIAIGLDDIALRWVALGKATSQAQFSASLEDIANRWEALGRAAQQTIEIIENYDFSTGLAFNDTAGSARMSFIKQSSEAAKLAANEAKEIENLQDKYKDLAIQIGQDAFISFFDAIGKAAAGTQSFADAMQNLIAQVAASIGRLMVQAGLEIIIANAYNPAMIALGLSLMVAGGVTIAAGAYVGAKSGGGDSTVPAMAEGGIVTRPTLALIGEKGPEAVVPLGRGMGGNTVINVYGSVWQTQDLARAVAGAQARW